MNINDDYLDNPSATPIPEIARLEAALAPLREIDVMPRTATVARGRGRRTPYVWMLLAAASLLVVVHLYGQLWRSWTVIETGRSVADIVTLKASRSVSPGDVIVTGSHQRARLNLGAVGRTEIAPSSRVRIIRAAESGYQLALEQGEIHARIWAPPRFFTVRTAAGTAIDLGCVYTLRATADGRSLLRVTGGEVELEHEGGTIVVPAGNEATIGTGKRIALPVPSSANDTLRIAVSEFEGNPENPSSLTRLLAATDNRSTIVLWHLLNRLNTDQRSAVYARLGEIVTAPHPSLDATVALEPQALEKWRTILEPGWSTEKPGWIRRQFRSIWRTIH
ncbi:MAG TPA: FecR domain-containing protein [Gemmatimonadaceae bacterium]